MREKHNLVRREIGNFQSFRTVCQTPLLKKTAGSYTPYHFLPRDREDGVKTKKKKIIEYLVDIDKEIDAIENKIESRELNEEIQVYIVSEEIFKINKITFQTIIC